MFPSAAFHYKGPAVISVPPIHILTADPTRKTETKTPPPVKNEEPLENERKIYSPMSGMKRLMFNFN